MKKALIAFGMILIATPSLAGGIVSKMSSSVQLTVDAAKTTATRIGNSYSISGNGVNTTDGSTAGTISAGGISNGILAPGTIAATQANNGNSFSYSQSFTQGDALVTSAPTVGVISPLSSQVVTAAGSAGSLAGTVLTTGAVTVTAGGAGTSGIGQFVSEITIVD